MPQGRVENFAHVRVSLVPKFLHMAPTCQHLWQKFSSASIVYSSTLLASPVRDRPDNLGIFVGQCATSQAPQFDLFYSASNLWNSPTEASTAHIPGLICSETGLCILTCYQPRFWVRRLIYACMQWSTLFLASFFFLYFFIFLWTSCTEALI